MTIRVTTNHRGGYQGHHQALKGHCLLLAAQGKEDKEAATGHLPLFCQATELTNAVTDRWKT